VQSFCLFGDGSRIWTLRISDFLGGLSRKSSSSFLESSSFLLLLDCSSFSCSSPHSLRSLWEVMYSFSSIASAIISFWLLIKDCCWFCKVNLMSTGLKARAKCFENNNCSTVRRFVPSLIFNTPFYSTCHRVDTICQVFPNFPQAYCSLPVCNIASPRRS
jgi:hypothetical protein